MLSKLLAAATALLVLPTCAHAQTQRAPIGAPPGAATPLTGSELLPCMQGGVAKSCLASGLSPSGANGATFVAASAYGVSPRNADNSAAFKAIDAAGQVAVLAPGVYNVAKTIAFSHPQTGVICNSGANVVRNVDVSQAGGCWLKWTGARGGTIMSIIAPTGSPSDGALYGNVVQGINFDGDSGLAANGLVLESERMGTFSNLYFQNFAGGYDLDVNVANPSSSSQFGDVCDSQHSDFRSLSFFQYNYSSTAIRLGDYANPSISNSGCNASENSFYNVSIGFSSGEGVLIDGGDNNRFYNLTEYHAGNIISYAIDFDIHNQNGSTYPANSNVFYSFSTNAPWISRGQTSHPGCVAYTGAAGVSNVCVFGNLVYGTDEGNGTPAPTVEPGANISYVTSQGNLNGMSATRLAVGDTSAGAVQKEAAIGSESLHVMNGSGNHIVLDDGANAWGVNIWGDHGLRIGQLAGPAAPIQLENPVALGNILTPSPSYGIAGATNGGSAPAGSLGEYQSSSFSSVSIPYGSGVINLTSITLTPGDWDVEAAAAYSASSGGYIETCVTGISTTPATLPGPGSSAGGAFGPGAELTLSNQVTPLVREDITAPTTIYAVSSCSQTSTTGSVSASGLIRARRVW